MQPSSLSPLRAASRQRAHIQELCDPTRDETTTENRDGPREGRPNAKVLAKTHVTDIVADGSDSIADAAAPGRRRSRRIPTASASLYEPAAGRTWWWISLRCPHCGSVHLARVRTEGEAPGPRRAGCGRMVLVMVRRTYRSHATRQAAA